MARDLNKRRSLISYSLVVGVLLLAIAILFSPSETDWNPSFSKRHSIPLGMELVYGFMGDMFPDKDVKVVYNGFASYFDDSIPSDVNLLFVNDRLLMTREDWEVVLAATEAGSNVFIAAEHFSDIISDTLGINLSYGEPISFSLLPDSVGYNFTNPRLKVSDNFWYSSVITNNYFARYDTLNTTVLGHNHRGDANFIRIKRGKGNIYLNCNPIVFTNYHLLNSDNGGYIFRALSYLPIADTYWDEKYKTGAPAMISEMGIVFREKSLRFAWYLLLISLLLYFIFFGKRRQRPIPIYEAPGNSTLEFVETIARLYFIKGDHRNVAKKRFLYFLDSLRSRYFIDVSMPESKLIEECSRKSGVPERTFASIFSMAKKLEKVEKITLEDLYQFNRQLEFFYKNAQ
jgi:hypothetical protein